MAIIKKGDINELREYENVPSYIYAKLSEMHERYRKLYDSKSDKWRNGEKGEALLSWLSALDDVVLAFENATTLSDLLDENDYSAIL